MSGLIITLRKNPFRYFEKNSNEYVLLGHYDRLEVRESFMFSDFFYSTPIVKNNETAENIKQEDYGILNPASYGETQRICLLRLPKKDYLDEEIKLPKAFLDLQLESGKNSSIPYNIAQERDCRICKKRFTPRYFVISLLSLNEFADLYYSLLAPRMYLFQKLESHIEHYAMENHEKNSLHIYFEIFSLIGSGEIGILWYTEDITFPAKCLQYMKRIVFGADKKIPLVSSVYSVMALIPSTDPKLTICGDKEKDIYVDIHLSYKDNAAPQEILSKLQEELIDYKIEKTGIRYGNYDTTVRIPASRVPLKLYFSQKCDTKTETDTKTKDFYLDFRSKIFRDNCLQVYTRLVFYENNVDIVNEQIGFDDDQNDELKKYFNHNAIEEFNNPKKQDHNEENKDRLNDLSILTKELINPSNIDNKGKEVFLRAHHLKEAIAQTFHGLTRIITSGHNNRWGYDLCNQYEAVIRTIEKMVKQDEKYGESMGTYDEIVRLLRALQQTYGHIEQGSRTYFDAPGSGLSYAGSHKRVIWAYYGIVKLIIEIIYRLKRIDPQKRLTPILEFSDTPRVECVDFPYEFNNEESIVLLCTLPYASLYNMPKYIRFLAHELHHFCAPPDRVTRNRIFGVYAIARMLSYYMSTAIIETSKPQDTEEHKILIENHCQEMAFTFMIEKYNDIFERCYFNQTDKNNKKRTYANSPSLMYLLYLSSIFRAKSWDEFKNKYDAGDDPPEIVSILEMYYDWLEEFLKKVEKKKNDKKTHTKGSINYIAKMFKEDLKIESAARKILESKEIFVNSFKKIFIDKDKSSDELNKVMSDVRGVMEASCDYFAQQITELNENIKDDKIIKYEQFQYLDSIADYLYATGEDISILERNAAAYSTRLGIHLKRFFSNSPKDNDKEKLSDLLDKWKEANESIKDKRKNENRFLGRIEFRIQKCRDLFMEMYSQFKDERGLYFVNPDLLYLSNFSKVFNEMFDLRGGQWDEDYKIFGECVERFREISRKYYEIQKRDQEENSKKIRSALCFGLHAEIIEYFNRQPRLDELDEIYKKVTHNKTELEVSENFKKLFGVAPKYETNYLPRYEYEVRTIDEFFERYKRLSDRLIKNGAKFIWYHGIENSSWDLKPSLYREIKDIRDKSTVPINETISDFQQMYLDQFVARVRESSEISGGRMMGVIDWIACMQHYSAPTNLLDWSENLLIAMYFMLEPLILFELDKNKSDEKKNLEIKKRKDISLKNGVSLYLFDPITYNNMWLERLDEKKLNVEKLKVEKLKVGKLKVGKLNEKEHILCKYIINNEKLCNRIKDINLPKLMPLPNLSMAYCANQFAAYVLGDPKDKICENDNNKMSPDCVFQNPIAILTSQSNPNLKAQAGTFLAFSLYRDKDNLQDTSLETLQTNLMNDNKVMKPFLYKITLKGEGVLNKIMEWTRAAGMSTYKVYPDLQNIGAFVKGSTGS